MRYCGLLGVLDLVSVEKGIFLVSYQFKNCEDDGMWVFTSEYGPVCRRDRESFWDELGTIKGLWSDPWCIRGDFNITRNPQERSREGSLSPDIRRSLNIMEELESKELPLQEGPYTRS